MKGIPTGHNTPDGGYARRVLAEIEGENCLSTSARLSLWILAHQTVSPEPAMIQELVAAHGWTTMRAWRHWRGCSKTEIAHRLGIQVSTYELIEDGSVDLGPFLQPAVESIVLF